MLALAAAEVAEVQLTIQLQLMVAAAAAELVYTDKVVVAQAHQNVVPTAKAVTADQVDKGVGMQVQVEMAQELAVLAGFMVADQAVDLVVAVPHLAAAEQFVLLAPVQLANSLALA
jgi:hypothetical protein